MDKLRDNLTREERSAIRIKEQMRLSSAVRRILEISTELHLTWEDFEWVLSDLKRRAYICSAPIESDNQENSSKYGS